MGDTKILVPDGAGFGGNGLEGAMIGAMMNGGGWGGMNGANGIWPLIYLVAMRNIFGNEWNGGGGYGQLSQIQEQLQTMQGQNSLMNAITGGTNEVRSLANTLNCDINAVQAGINAVQTAICNVGNQMGIGQMQVINAVQNGDSGIISALQSCCCDVKNTITNLNYEGRLADQAQTAFLGGKIDAQTTLINDKFCQLEMRSMQDKLNAERDKTLALTNQLSQEHQSALFGQQIAQATAPIIAAQNAMAKEVNDIKCKLPNTVTVQSNEGVLIPSCVAWQAALANGGFPFNFQPQGNVFS